jgi:hypothetical protein
MGLDVLGLVGQRVGKQMSAQGSEFPSRAEPQDEPDWYSATLHTSRLSSALARGLHCIAIGKLKAT